MALRGKKSEELTQEILELFVEYQQLSTQDVGKLLRRFKLDKYTVKGKSKVISAKALNARMLVLLNEGLLAYFYTGGIMKLTLLGRVTLLMMSGRNQQRHSLQRVLGGIPTRGSKEEE